MRIENRLNCMKSCYLGSLNYPLNELNNSISDLEAFNIEKIWTIVPDLYQPYRIQHNLDTLVCEVDMVCELTWLILDGLTITTNML
jgi:hypothetical protein